MAIMAKNMAKIIAMKQHQNTGLKTCIQSIKLNINVNDHYFMQCKVFLCFTAICQLSSPQPQLVMIKMILIFFSFSEFEGCLMISFD